MPDKYFIKDLIKGKIAEIIFQQMFEEAGECTVIPLGYENTVPELAQYHNLIKLQKVLSNIRRLPDFVLINQDKTQAYFVEVKFRKELQVDDILKQANKTIDIWDPKMLFVATPKGFFLSPCNTVINKHGKVDPLPTSWISLSLQQKYLEVLNEFER